MVGEGGFDLVVMSAEYCGEEDGLVIEVGHLYTFPLLRPRTKMPLCLDRSQERNQEKIQ